LPGRKATERRGRNEQRDRIARNSPQRPQPLNFRETCQKRRNEDISQLKPFTVGSLKTGEKKKIEIMSDFYCSKLKRNFSTLARRHRKKNVRIFENLLKSDFSKLNSKFQ
jgi:hypothetical protein